VEAGKVETGKLERWKLGNWEDERAETEKAETEKAEAEGWEAGMGSRDREAVTIIETSDCKTISSSAVLTAPHRQHSSRPFMNS
jgi:hypothetical protein